MILYYNIQFAFNKDRQVTQIIDIKLWRYKSQYNMTISGRKC